MTDPVATPPKKLSAPKRLLGMGILLLIMIVCGPLFFYLMHRHDLAPGLDDASSFEAAAPILFIVIGAFFLVLAIATYSVVLATSCVTFSFKSPVYTRSFKSRLWLANLITSFLFAATFGFMVGSTLYLLLRHIIPGPAALPVSIFLPFMAGQLLTIYFQIWAPLEKRLIHRRLRARGLTNEQIAAGRLIGISNPDRSSFKKFGSIEDEIGMLFVYPQRLVFRGDAEDIAIDPPNLLQLERKPDAGATSSYFGSVPIILHVRQSDGSRRRIRLHVEGHWTQHRRAAALNNLAEEIDNWRTAAQSAPSELSAEIIE